MRIYAWLSLALLAAASSLAGAAPPLKHQLPIKLTRLEFLGWSDDGRSFALRARHGRDMGELEGSSQLELFQVHDALTGKLTGSFRIELGKDNGKESLHRRAWEEARPQREWPAFKATLKLTGGASSLASPDGWTLSAEAASKPRHGKLALTTRPDRLLTAWSGFATKPLAEGEDAMTVFGVKGKGEPGPSIRLLASRAGERRTLLTYQVPFSYREIIECVGYGGKPGRAVGIARAYFAPKRSPLGARALIALDADLEGYTEESPQSEVRYYLRALGPQLELVAAPAGEEAARALATRLAAAGLPVTHLSLEGARAERPQIYHRGPGGAALAQKVAGVVGGQAAIAPLTKPGWLDLVVVLGR